MSIRLQQSSFILARVMQMFEILNNQSDAARRLLKSRHPAHRMIVYYMIVITLVHGYNYWAIKLFSS